MAASNVRGEERGRLARRKRLSLETGVDARRRFRFEEAGASWAVLGAAESRGNVVDAQQG